MSEQRVVSLRVDVEIYPDDNAELARLEVEELLIGGCYVSAKVSHL